MVAEFKKFIKSKKLGDFDFEDGDDDIQPWADDENKTYSKAEQKEFTAQNIAAGEDVVGQDIFSGQTAIGGSSSKGYIPENPEAARQLVRERGKSKFGIEDIDTEIELRQSMFDVFQGQQASIDVQNKPGVQAKEIAFNVKDAPADFSTDVRQPVPTYQVTPEGIIEPQITRPYGIKSRKPIGVKGPSQIESMKAFKNAEELASLKIKRNEIVRDINFSTFGVNYQDEVLTRTQVAEIQRVASLEGISKSEALNRVIPSQSDITAATGDRFQTKQDWKQLYAYDYSLVEEGNEFRDYQNEVMEKRFPDTTMEERLALSGTESFREYPKGGGRGGVRIPGIQEAANLSSSNMTGGTVSPPGYKQAEMIRNSIVYWTPSSSDNKADLGFSMDEYEAQAKRILGKDKAKQHMKDIVNPMFGMSSDPKVGDLRLTAPEKLSVQRSIGAGGEVIRTGPAFELLQKTHAKIESAAKEAAIIKKDIADIMGGATTKDINAYFKGQTLSKFDKATESFYKVSGAAGSFRDVRSATILGLDVEKLGLNLAPISRKRSNEIMEQVSSFDRTRSVNIYDPKQFAGTGGGARIENINVTVYSGSNTDTRYGTGGTGPIKQEGPQATTKPQEVVPNENARTNFVQGGALQAEPRRQEAYNRRQLSLEKKAQRILQTPNVALTPEEIKIKKDLNDALKKAVPGVVGLRGITGLAKIMSGGGGSGNFAK